MTSKVRALPLTETRYTVHKVTRYHGFMPKVVRYTVVDREQGVRLTTFNRRWVAWLYAVWVEAGRFSANLDWM